MDDPSAVTELLEAAATGDSQALDRLIRSVYSELERIAHRELGRERSDHTLETGALVHEAYLRLVGIEHVQWSGRSHFFAAAAAVMRRILIDYARRKRASKRGGGARSLPLDDVSVGVHQRADELLALDQALDRLATLSERQAKVVEYRFFAGMSNEEVAEALGVSTMTVKRDWTAARAWLNRELAA